MDAFKCLTFTSKSVKKYPVEVDMNIVNDLFSKSNKLGHGSKPPFGMYL